ncbi:hypothetical protein V8G54_007397 [Vigna mungo]|uniref:Uncharacterized protein n=1 Tax=Vigna mungo TaxID=3915 RepID=A0AAQ3P1T4_VIGMU
MIIFIFLQNQPLITCTFIPLNDSSFNHKITSSLLNPSLCFLTNPSIRVFFIWELLPLLEPCLSLSCQQNSRHETQRFIYLWRSKNTLFYYLKASTLLVDQQRSLTRTYVQLKKEGKW